MHTERASSALGEHVEIAARLRRLDHAERVFGTRHREVRAVVRRHLEEHAAVRAALVGLTGRVQETGSELGRGRDVLRIADRLAHPLDPAPGSGLALDIGEHPDIVARADAPEMRAQDADRVGALQLGRVARVREEAECAVRGERLLVGQGAGLVVGVGKLLRLELARLDVGLVEGVDADDRACNRGRHLPAEELLHDRLRVRKRDRDHRLPCLGQRLDRRVLLRVGLVGKAEIGEHAIRAVDLRGTRRLVVDRDQAVTVLAGALGQELLQPGAHVGDRRRGDEGHLVAPEIARRDAEDGAEMHARVLQRRHAVGAGPRHRATGLEELAHVDARGGGGHQAEIRQHRVAAADPLVAVEDPAEPVILRDLLHVRAGIGDGDEMVAGAPLAEGIGRELEEICLEDVGFQRAARLRRHDEQRVRGIDPAGEARDLLGIGAVEHEELGPAAAMAEGLGENLRAERRAAHPEQQRVAEAGALDVGREGFELVDMREALVDDVKPGEPFRLVLAGPDRGVARPQLADRPLLAPLVEHRADRLLEVRRKLRVGGREMRAEQRHALGGDRAEQGVERVGEGLHAFGDEAPGDAGKVETETVGLGEGVTRRVEIGGERGGDRAVIAERVHRRGRHRVDGVGADQLVDVQHVGVGLVLGPGGRPEQALRIGAGRLERLPARRGGHLEVVLVGELRVGDRDLAADRLKRVRLRVAGGDPLVDRAVDLAVDAAHEERGDGGEMRDVLALAVPLLETLEIGFQHRLVGVEREQQRHVDVDAVGDQAADGRNALVGARHLDHQVPAVDAAPEVLRLRDRRLGGEREIGRHLEADIAVGAFRLVPHRLQHVGGGTDVGDRTGLIHGRDVVLARAHDRLHLVVVFRPVTHRLLEDRRVRRHATQSVPLDQLLQLAVGDEAPLDEVEPWGLAGLAERLQGVGAVDLGDHVHGWAPQMGSRPRGVRVNGCASPARAPSRARRLG